MKKDLKEEKKVLFFCSVTEFAERYGYYVIQSLLIFFLIDKYNLSESISASLVGTTLSMIYISAILGGYIAEKYLNYYRTAILGTFFMIAGFFIIASFNTKDFLYLGLSFISISSGLIKSNMSSFIGRFYDKSVLNNSHRDFGFNIFYMGINLGTFCALLFSTYLKNDYGFSIPFYISMIVSILMLFFLLIGFKVLNNHIIETKLTKIIVIKIFILLSIYLVFLFFVFKHAYIADLSIFFVLLISPFILIYSSKNSKNKIIIVSSIFFILSIIYWAIYFQIYISLLLFSEYAVNNTIVNSSQLLSVSSLSILIFAFIMGKIWIFFSKIGKEVQDIDKFNIGFIFIIISFSIILFSILVSPLNSKVSIVGFIIAYMLIGISELSLSAIGLSMITKIAPKGFVALYMGVWLVTIGLGGKMGGFIASYIYIPKDNIQLAKLNMSHGLEIFIIIGVVTALAIFLIRKYINSIESNNGSVAN